MIKLAFKNKDGRTVRVIESGEINLIACLDKKTNRVEFISTNTFNKDDYKLIKEISRSDLNTQPISLGKYGNISIHTDDNQYSASPIVRFDKPNAVKKYLKPVSITQIAILLICFSILHFSKIENKSKNSNIKIFKVSKVIHTKRTIIKAKKNKNKFSGIKNKKKKVTKKTPKKKKIYASSKKRKKLAFKAKNKSKKNVRTAYSKRKSKVAKYKSHKRGRIAPRKKQRASKRKNNTGTRTVIAKSGILNLLDESSTNSNHLNKKGYASNNNNKKSTGNSISEYNGLLTKRNRGSQSGNTLVNVKTKGTAGGDSSYGKSNISLKGRYKGSFYALGNYSEISGGLSQGQIEEVIRRHQGQLRYCYESSLQVSPNLNGRVDVKFIINGKGRVRTANVKKTTLRSKKVETCLISKLKKWKFPVPVGNVDVKVAYPFNFKRPGANKKLSKNSYDYKNTNSDAKERL